MSEVMGILDDPAFSDLHGLSLLAETLHKARMEAGMTQKQLAELSGMHQVNISRIEGRVCNPSVETLQRIADALGKKLVVAIV